MRRALLIVAVAASLVGCVSVKTEVREIDGQKFLCTWQDSKIFPDEDLRCEPYPVSQP